MRDGELKGYFEMLFVAFTTKIGFINKFASEQGRLSAIILGNAG
jgi:hypothetical protein